jgi:hypothetical protein
VDETELGKAGPRSESDGYAGPCSAVAGLANTTAAETIKARHIFAAPLVAVRSRPRTTVATKAAGSSALAPSFCFAGIWNAVRGTDVKSTVEMSMMENALLRRRAIFIYKIN